MFVMPTLIMKILKGKRTRAMAKPLFNELVSAVLGGSKGEKEPGKQRVGKLPVKGNNTCKSPEVGGSQW